MISRKTYLIYSPVGHLPIKQNINDKEGLEDSDLTDIGEQTPLPKAPTSKQKSVTPKKKLPTLRHVAFNLKSPAVSRRRSLSTPLSSRKGTKGRSTPPTSILKEKYLALQSSLSKTPLVEPIHG